jgi:hypothetical protein
MVNEQPKPNNRAEAPITKFEHESLTFKFRLREHEGENNRLEIKSPYKNHLVMLQGFLVENLDHRNKLAGMRLAQFQVQTMVINQEVFCEVRIADEVLRADHTEVEVTVGVLSWE